MTSKMEYDMIPKLMITTHGKWNVPRNSSKGHPTFRLPYNVRIMYATGMGVLNYLDQTVANRINNEYKRKRKYGVRKINKFKKDLRSLDLHGCCDKLACKDNRRNAGQLIKEVIEIEEEDSDSEKREYATEFLDHTDAPYRITRKQKGAIMPLKTHEIVSSEFGIDDEGCANRDNSNINDNVVLLYIPGHKPINVLYNWDIGNPKDKPYISAKLRNKDTITITFKQILLRVKNICGDLGIELNDIDVIDLSCNVTTDIYDEKAPRDPEKRVEYINTLKDMVFGDDEITSSASDNEEDAGILSMLTNKWNPEKKQTKKQKNKKTNQSRRYYAKPQL
jgi:hypothetical protein